MVKNEFGRPKYQEATYLRDVNNNLLEIKIRGKNDVISLVGDNPSIKAQKYEYDNAGNRVKRITSSSTVYIQRPPSSSSTKVVIESEYDSEGHLREKTTSFYDKSTGRLTRRIKEESKYDYLISRIEYNETYNSVGEVVKETEYVESIYGARNTIPTNESATEKEWIEEDIRTFGSSLKPSDNITRLLDYDQYGNETSMEWWDDLDDESSCHFKSNRSGRKLKYEYNSNGDWIKCIFYTYRFGGALSPRYICIREISYL